MLMTNEHFIFINFSPVSRVYKLPFDTRGQCHLSSILVTSGSTVRIVWFQKIAISPPKDGPWMVWTLLPLLVFPVKLHTFFEKFGYWDSPLPLGISNMTTLGAGMDVFWSRTLLVYAKLYTNNSIHPNSLQLLLLSFIFLSLNRMATPKWPA